MSWRLCSSCKSEIDYRATYWVCSVSTCTRPRTGMYFCSVSCWEVHLPTMRHREAWAVEKHAPSKEAWERTLAEQRDQEPTQAAARPKPAAMVSQRTEAPSQRRTISPAKNEAGEDLPRDVLIVVSKLKKYIKARSGMKTSDTVMPALSDELRRICDRAIRVAEENGRRTVMDRDVRDALR